MAGGDRQRSAMLEEEACHRKECHAPSRNNTVTKWRLVGNLLLKLLPSMDRLGGGDPSGMLVDQIRVAGKFIRVYSRR